MVGLLGNPFVTILYFLEQMDIFLLGSTPRASDIRILLSVATNIGFICIGNYAVTPAPGSRTSVNLVLALLAYLASHNVWHSLGLKKPFSAENPKLK